MQRMRNWVGAAVWLLACGGMAWGAEDTPAKRPNVVLVIIDALRADRMGCYGFGEDTSPELDALAARGVLFARVVAPCSWTRPSIGAMLTGRYPRSLGLYDERNETLPDRFTTLAEALQAQGYATVGATANPIINSVFNMHQGFDRYLDSSVVLPWMREDAREGAGDRRKDRLPEARSLFEALLAAVPKNPAVPCYLQVNVMEVHEAWRGKKSLTRPEYAGMFKGCENRGYLAALRQVSADIDAFVRRLVATPGWADTLFIITSDHGQGLKSHPHVLFSTAHGRLLYESHLVVPLILYRSGEAFEPRRVERPVRLIDLMPTVLDCLGAPVPEGLDGTSLKPLLEGRDVNLPAAFFAETEYRDYDKAAVYSGEWKYIENRDRHWGLPRYELQRAGVLEDGKRTNLAKDHPEVVERLRGLLREWESRTPREAPTPCGVSATSEEMEQIKAIGYLN